MICQDSVSETPTKGHCQQHVMPTKSDLRLTDKKHSCHRQDDRKQGAQELVQEDRQSLHTCRKSVLYACNQTLYTAARTCVLCLHLAYRRCFTCKRSHTGQVHNLCAETGHAGQMQMVAVPLKRLHCTAAESQESSGVTAEPAKNLLSYVLAATATQPERGKTVLCRSSSPVVSSWHTSSR